MDTNYTDNNSRAEGTEKNKDKKTEDKVDKKKIPKFFSSSPDKGAYTTK